MTPDESAKPYRFTSISMSVIGIILAAVPLAL